MKEQGVVAACREKLTFNNEVATHVIILFLSANKKHSTLFNVLNVPLFYFNNLIFASGGNCCKDCILAITFSILTVDSFVDWGDGNRCILIIVYLHYILVSLLLVDLYSLLKFKIYFYV